MVHDTIHAITSTAAPYFEAAAPAVIGYLGGRGLGALIRGRREGTTALEEWNGEEARYLGGITGLSGVALGVGNFPDGIGPSEIDTGMQLLGGIGIGAIVGEGIGRLVSMETTKENVAEKSARAGQIGRGIGALATPSAYLALTYLSQRL